MTVVTVYSLHNSVDGDRIGEVRVDNDELSISFPDRVFNWLVSKGIDSEKLSPAEYIEKLKEHFAQDSKWKVKVSGG